MPIPRRRKATASQPPGGIAAVLRNIVSGHDDGGERVALTDLLDGVSTHAGPLDETVQFHLQPKPNTVQREVELRQLEAYAMHTGAGPARQRAGLPAAPVELRPHRPVGLQSIVVELLDRCATDDGMHALSRMWSIPGSATMNPVARAVARATGSDDVWIGEEHRTVHVGRAGVTVHVELPERLQGLLDAMDITPQHFPHARYAP